LAVDREHQQDRVLGHRNGVAGLQPRYADALRTTNIKIDAIDAGAQFLDEAQPCRLRQQFLRDRRGHHQSDVGVPQHRGAGSQAILADEMQSPIRRRGLLDRSLDRGMKLVEDGNRNGHG
jgi:hypothetical protein